MNGHMVFGLFALYVAAISLYLVLSGRQDTLLALLRGFWGRPLGHSFYFIANVALPVVICVLSLGWGVRQYDPKLATNGFETSLRLNVDSYRDINTLLQKEQMEDPLGIVYGA